MFHYLKVTVTKCVSSEPFLLTLSRKLGEDQAKGVKTTHSSVSVQYSQPAPSTCSCLLWVLLQTRRREINHYILSSVPSHSGSHTGMEIGCKNRQVKTGSFASHESQPCSPPQPQPLSQQRWGLGICPVSTKAHTLHGWHSCLVWGWRGDVDEMGWHAYDLSTILNIPHFAQKWQKRYWQLLGMEILQESTELGNNCSH